MINPSGPKLPCASVRYVWIGQTSFSSGNNRYTRFFSTAKKFARTVNFHSAQTWWIVCKIDHGAEAEQRHRASPDLTKLGSWIFISSAHGARRTLRGAGGDVYHSISAPISFPPKLEKISRLTCHGRRSSCSRERGPWAVSDAGDYWTRTRELGLCVGRRLLLLRSSYLITTPLQARLIYCHVQRTYIYLI